MANERQKKPGWYSDAKNYWDNVDSNIDGMLGGYGRLTDIDAQNSTRFIEEHIKSNKLKTNRAADCGAGIGRVTRNFLLNHFKNVTLVEQTEKFLETAKNEFGQEGLSDRLDFIPIGLQDFYPKKGEYDLIWIQWVLTHLTDDDLVSFIKRSKESLDGGYIGIKENICHAGTEYDDEDSSCTRSDYVFKELFERAGATVVKESLQTGFPSTLYKVKLYLLK